MKLAENPVHTVQGCCSTTEDGSAVCIVPQNGEQAGCSCHATNTIALETIQNRTEQPGNHFSEQIRSIFLFAVACITSLCCTPLIVPLVLWLFAGTPLAIWLGHNLGWVYGALTLVSIVSFVLAVRGMKTHKSLFQKAVRHTSSSSIVSQQQ